MSALELSHITHHFDARRVVDDLSLAVEAGEIIALLGPSGCGKSTSLRIAAGLERVQAGEVHVGGAKVGDPGLHVPPEERHIGLVLQDFALFPHLRIIENVAFGMRDLAAEHALKRAYTWLEKLDMAGHAHAFPHQLSGGEQQRVALARALAPSPAVMLMDEPFSSLDVTLRDRVRDETLTILKDTGVPTLLVTHDPGEAMRLADRIAVMRHGRLVQTGTPDEIYNHPVRAFVMRLFGNANAFGGMVRGGAVETPLGRLPAPGFKEGEAVVLMARSHDIELAPAGEGTEATVARVRLTGTDRLVDAQLPGAKGVLEVRLPADSEIRAGDRVGIHVDPEKTFIFAHRPDNSTTG